MLKDRDTSTNNNTMEHLVDDGMCLNAMSNDGTSTIIDKGFVDALRCDDVLHENINTNTNNAHGANQILKLRIEC